MSVGASQYVAQHVRDLIERQRLDALADRELLSHFVANRDDVAFAAIVRRHGPMVLGVCRRILHNAHDAEDACQAVFLILTRKAGTIHGRRALGGWLHRVAVRAASRLRATIAHRTVESLPPEVAHTAPTPDELTWREVRGAFDAEVGRLPDKFRLPLVLCCLEGRTRTEAARELGWSEGALRGRLDRGRKLLQARFARKGLVLPAIAFPLGLELIAPAEGAATSTVAASLADGVLRSMAVARAKLAACATAAVLLIGTTAGLVLPERAGAQPKSPDAPPERPANVADAAKNLDTFILRVSLAPAGEGKFDPKYTLYHVLLYVPNLRLEPPPNGPSGKPTEAHTRITKEQAKKLLGVLNEFGFFDDKVAKEKLGLMNARNWPHAGITVRFQGGEDSARKERLLTWLPSMLPPLDAIRGCVDGDARKAMDQLLAQLAEERKRWTPSPADADFQKLQGIWGPDDTDDHLRLGGRAPGKHTIKCVIEWSSMTFKPRVQLDPLLDLETFRGKFELKADRVPRQLIFKGTRDTVTTTETGTWTLLYEVTDDKLMFLLPPMGKAPPADGKPRWDQGDRQFLLKRIPTGLASEWGEASNHVQTRIRAPKAKYAASDPPTFDLDVRDTHAGIAGKPWHWLAPRVGTVARVEVDGVWYSSPDSAFKKHALHELKLGQSVERWATVTLINESWATDGPTPKALVLSPGKHKVRVALDFSPSEAGVAAGPPVSGPLEIEVLPVVATGKAAALDEWTAAKAWSPHGKQRASAAAFSPDGTRLVTVAGGEVVVWDMTGAEPKEFRRRKSDGLEFLGFDPKGELMFLRRQEGREPGGSRSVTQLAVVREWDIAKDILAPMFTFEGNSVQVVSLSADARRLAVVGNDWNNLRVIDLDTRKFRYMDAPKQTPGAFALPAGLAFAADGKTLIGHGATDYPVVGKVNGSVGCWDADTGAVRWYVEEATGQRVAAVSADGTTVATAGPHTGRATVRDAASGKKLHDFPADWVTAIGLSPDGKTVAFGTNVSLNRQANVAIYDVSRPTRPAFGKTVGMVERIAFRPDGGGFVTVDDAGDANWWVRK